MATHRLYITRLFIAICPVIIPFLLSGCLLAQPEVSRSSYELKPGAATTHQPEPLIPDVEPASRPKNIILMIGDGMAISHITAGMVANHGDLYMSQFQHIGLMTTHPVGELVTGSCAAATAMATGHKTLNNRIGIDEHGEPLTNIREILARHGIRTGLVATSTITHATPAGFYARQPHRGMKEEIARDLVDANVDLFMGGGLRHFTERKDGANLLDDLANNGYYIDTQTVAIDPVITVDSLFARSRFAGLYARGHLAKAENGRIQFLPMATQSAIRFLDNEHGFFLMIEGSQIDWGGHATNTQYIVEELLDFDRAVGEALRFALEDGNTLLLVTSDHECGGMAIESGDFSSGSVVAKYTHAGHTGTLVPMFAFGPGAELFTGFFDNTDLPKRMALLMGVELPGM